MLYFVTVRLSPSEVQYLSRKVIKTLIAEGKLEVDAEDEVMEAVARVIIQELQREDQLNDDVREVLIQHSDEMARSNITYNEMFKMVKRKLAKEKGLIL